MNVFSHDYVESLYQKYQEDPASVSPDWREYFDTFDDSSSESTGPASVGSAATRGAESVAQLQDRVDQMIRGFRVRGHLEARIDPLNMPRPTNRELNLEAYSLLPTDMEKRFSARTIHGENFMTLREIVELSLIHI